MEFISQATFGFSCSSIVLTVIAFAAFIVLLIGIIKKKREPKGSKLFWPYLFLILILVALLVANNRTEYEKPEEITLQPILNETSSLLQNVQNKIDDVSLEDLSKQSTDKWFDEKFLDAELKQDGHQEITKSFDRTNQGINKYLEKIRVKKIFLQEMLTYWKSRDNLRDVYCRLGFTGRCETIMNNTNSFESALEKLFEIVPEMNRRVDLVCGEIKNDVDVMKLKDFGGTKIENDLIKRKTMVSKFRASIDNTVTIGQDWVKRFTDSLPDKPAILKSLIIRASLCHMLLSVITLVIMIVSKHLPQIVVSIAMSFMVVLTVILTISLNAYVITLYIQFQTECSLNNDNFGLLNFTSSVPKNEQYCQTPNQTFFESLTSEMLNFPNVIQDYNIRQHIEDIKQKTTVKMEGFEFPIHIMKLLHVMPVLTKEIEAIATVKRTRSCPGPKLYISMRDRGVTEVNQFMSSMLGVEQVLDEYNDLLADGTIANQLMTIFEQPYRTVSTLYTEAVHRIQQKTNATEFPCQVIYDKYSDAGNTICRPFHGQVTLLWVYVIVIIFCFTASVISNVLVLRNLKSGKKSGKLDEPQTPPSLPPTPSTPTTQKMSV